MTTRYQRHSDIRLTGLEGEGVALHLGTRRYYGVTATGYDLLQWMETPRTLDELVALLTAKYDVSQEDARRTTRDFLDQGMLDGVLISREQG